MTRLSRHHDSILTFLAFVSLLAGVSLIQCAAAGPSSQPSPPAASQPAADGRIVKVLYVEGYPRWEYRYIKLALLHQPAVRMSCLLTSADPGYEQEASDPNPKIGFLGRVKAFPESADALSAYDVILFGDVDRRLFTDKQLGLVADFVRRHGGGFGMIAGPRFAPVGYRDTPIAGLLPVNFDRVAADGKDEQFSEGFRPALTPAGRDSPIFKILQPPVGAADAHPELPEGLLYWYCRGVTVQAAAGQKPPQILAVHPSAKAPDGTDAPLLVLGRCGEGAVLFSAIDDSWRWRAAGGQSAYVNYWVEQLRALAPAGAAKRDRLPAH